MKTEKVTINSKQYCAIQDTMQEAAGKLCCSASLKDEIVWVIMDELMEQIFALQQERK